MVLRACLRTRHRVDTRRGSLSPGADRQQLWCAHSVDSKGRIRSAGEWQRLGDCGIGEATQVRAHGVSSEGAKGASCVSSCAREAPEQQVQKA